MKIYIVSEDNKNIPTCVRIKIIEYLEDVVFKREFQTLTKKEVYLALGFKKPNKAFNSAWGYLAKGRGEFMAYDKDIKKWIWL